MASTRSGYTALTPETTAFPTSTRDIRAAVFVPASVRSSRASNTHSSEATSPGSSIVSSLSYLFERASSFVHAIARIPFTVSRALHDFVDDNAGLLLVALAQFFLALVNVAVKKLNMIDNPVPTLELVWVRMFITYLCCMTFMWWQKVPDPFLGPKGVRLLLVFRGFVGFFGLFGVYFSLQYLSLSDATVLTFLSPIFTGIAGSLFLKEPLSRKELLAGLCSFAGVVLIARPEFMFGHAAHATAPSDMSTPPSEKGTPTQRLVAVGVSLLGVLGATGAYTTIRAIGRRAHPLHSLAFFSSQSVVVASIGMAATRVQIVIPRRWDWLAMLAVIGIFGFIAQVFLTMGLQREAAGRASLAIYIGIIYALALEKIFFNVSPSALSIVGMAIILSAALYIALTKENTKKKRPIPLALEDSALEEGLLSSESDDGDFEGHAMHLIDERKSPKGERQELEAENVPLALHANEDAPHEERRAES